MTPSNPAGNEQASPRPRGSVGEVPRARQRFKKLSLTAVLFCAALAGCSAVKPGPADSPAPVRLGAAFRPGPAWLMPPASVAAGQGDSFAVASASTPFYSFGPAQPRGPDRLLAKGEPVTVVKREYGFSKVRTEDGTEGYMATDRLATLPVPAPDSAPTRKPPRKLPGATPLKVVPFDRMFESVEPPLPTGGGSAGQ